MKLSIYDLDKTLCKKDTFNIFCIYLFKKKLISHKIFLLICLNYLLYILKLKGLKSVKENILLALKGRDKNEIKNIIEEFLSMVKQEYYRPELLNNIELEKNEGYVLVLLTGSPDIYAVKIAERLGFAKVIATKTEFNNNKFTARILEENSRGKEKEAALKQNININAYDLKLSRGYGNKDDMRWLNLLGYVKLYK